LSPTDFDRAVARSSNGDYRVSDLLDSWRRLSPAYRPRIETSAQIRDLVKNGMFERMLRHEADRRHLSERPPVARLLAEERERFAASHFVESQVTSKIARDSLTLVRYFRQHRPDWMLPMRIRVIRLLVPERSQAELMAVRLRDPVVAESLAARAERRGVHYRTEVSAQVDSSLFAAALKAGTGAVLGPVPLSGDWLVGRVNEILPGRPYRFDEVRSTVEQQWVTVETERRLEALCRELRKSVHVVLNDRALAAMPVRFDGTGTHP
jgi:hypothetical protein